MQRFSKHTKGELFKDKKLQKNIFCVSVESLNYVIMFYISIRTVLSMLGIYGHIVPKTK